MKLIQDFTRGVIYRFVCFSLFRGTINYRKELIYVQYYLLFNLSRRFVLIETNYIYSNSASLDIQSDLSVSDTMKVPRIIWFVFSIMSPQRLYNYIQLVLSFLSRNTPMQSSISQNKETSIQIFTPKTTHEFTEKSLLFTQGTQITFVFPFLECLDDVIHFIFKLHTEINMEFYMLSNKHVNESLISMEANNFK